MATIDSAIINIGPQVNNQVEVTVFCQISIRTSERQSQFRLECSVFGNDLLKDDFLFSYSPQFFFGFDVGPDRRFQKTVSHNLLNEDLVGRDEIIGKLTLRNVTLNRTVKRNTNVAEVV